MRRSIQRGLGEAVALGLLIAAGCKVGPDYVRPQVVTPQEYRGAQSAPPATQPTTTPTTFPTTRLATTQPGGTFGDMAWWEVFSDPSLKALIRQGLDNNYDLRVAISRVEQARAVELQARAGFFPQVSYAGGVGSGKNYLLNVPTLNNGNTSGSAFAVVNATWELDVWGRVRRTDEAARAQYLASQEGQLAVQLLVVSDIAQAYFELLGLDAQLQVSRSNLQSFQETLDLFKTRQAGEVGSQLQVSRAEGALRGVASSIPEVERLIQLKEAQISILLGLSPRSIPRDQSLLTTPTPPEIPVGLPSSLLERRPDVRSAEQQVIAANAQVGVAVANFFPQIGLTAVFGRVSPTVQDFASGKWNSYGIGADLTGPIFQGGRLIAAKEQALAFRKEVTILYQQAATSAFREVSDALVNRIKFAEARQERDLQVKALQQAAELATIRYVEGRASYFEVLEAKQQLFPAESEAALARTNELVTYVQLYRSLGGGWQSPTPTTAPAK